MCVHIISVLKDVEKVKNQRNRNSTKAEKVEVDAACLMEASNYIYET